MTEEELTEKTVDAIAKAIGDDLREALAAQPGTTLEQVKAQVMKTMCGATKVELDPDNPDCVLITWERPKYLLFEFELDLDNPH